ncbi:MAG TPA: radical SAM protein [Polyangiaceae bacterium]|nr:radical SAM protein [Polyangiaceae bacterium]
MQVQSVEELARVLWATGLSRWFALRQEWQLLPPEFEACAVTFTAQHGSEKLRFRVEPKPGERPAGIRGVPLSKGGESSALGELLAIVEILDRKGLRIEIGERAPSEVERRPTRRLELFIASGCNLDCSFCCEAERIAKKSFMPWEEIEQKLRAAAASGIRLIQFMGGEPTIHPRFADALALARELGMRTFVISNIMRWDDPEFARTVGPLLDEIMVSVHAFGQSRGLAVTGRQSWWPRFQRAAEHLRTEHRGSVRCATVLSHSNADHLERIADIVLSFGPTAWVLGNAVPVAGTRLDPELTNLTLSQQVALRPELRALRDRCADAHCRLVLFCVPHCVLGPELWDHSHDLFLGDQDLSDGASRDVNFWSRADYHDGPAPVTLARERVEVCHGCERRSLCGGYFSDYLRRHGSHELQPIVTES